MGNTRHAIANSDTIESQNEVGPMKTMKYTNSEKVLQIKVFLQASYWHSGVLYSCQRPKNSTEGGPMVAFGPVKKSDFLNFVSYFFERYEKVLSPEVDQI